MKTIVKIPKSRLTAPVNFDDVIYSHVACGVKLSYTEFGFIQSDDGGVVLFDAFSAAHKYTPFNVKCGPVAFPFYCGCMTDGGERVAYCGLRFGEERAKEWRLLGAEEAVEFLAVDRDAASVPISSGVCCLSDLGGYNEFYSHIRDDVHPLAGQILLNGQTHTVLTLYGKKYAVFSSGWGDGMYRCFAGVDGEGRTTAIIVDFGMIEYTDIDDTPVPVMIEIEENRYIYDPAKTESENNIARWTQVLSTSKDPNEITRAYSMRGYAYHSERNYDAALADYKRVVERLKDVTDNSLLRRAWSVFDNAAEIYDARSDYGSAIALMTQALSFNDDLYIGAYVRLIDLYLLSKRSDKALEIAERMIEKRPDDPVAHMKYAECCVSNLDYGSAAKAYELLASRFKLYENLFDEALCLIEQGDYAGADAALERHPFHERYEQYWYYKAYKDYKLRDYRSALENAERAYDMDREYLPALYLLIDTEAVLQEYHAVARYAEEYKKLRPAHEYGYSVCAEAQLLLGNISECARNYFYIYDKIKQDDKYAALAAVACFMSGDKPRGASLLKKLRKKHSDYYRAAMFGVYIAKYKQTNSEVGKIVYKLRTDNEFLLALAMFLLRDDRIVPATHLVGEMLKDENNRSFELVAEQIRIAVRINDKKQFLAFFNYYLENYFPADISDDDKQALAEKFLPQKSKQRLWLASI